MPAKNRILVVEDDLAILEVLEFALSDAGYHVQRAPDGLTAVRLLAELPPDIVLLDLRIPGRSGRDILRDIQEQVPPVPVILLSADRRIADEARELRADAYLAKPFDLDELLGLVARIGPGC